GRERGPIGVVASGTRREHAGSNRHGWRGAAVQAKRVVGVVDAEGRIDYRKHRLQFEPSRHARHPVGAGNGPEILRQDFWRKVYAARTRIPSLRTEDWTAEQSAEESLVLDGVDLQLRVAQDRVGTQVDKGSDGNRSGNGDAIFQVAVNREIAAGSHQLLAGDGDIPAVRGTGSAGAGHHREVRVGRNEAAIGISERNGLGAGQVGDRRNAANIETAQIIFTAQVGAFKWRGNHSVIAGDERPLHIVTDRVAPLLHGEKLFVRDDGPDRVNRAGERVGAADAAKVEITEQEFGRIAECDQRRAVERIAHAKAL